MASPVSLSRPRATAHLRGQKQQRQTKQCRLFPPSPSPLTPAPTSKPLPLRLASFLPPAALKKDDEDEKLSSSTFPAPLPLVPVLSRSAERTIGRTAMLGFACAVAGEVLAGGGGPLSQLHLLRDGRAGAGFLPSFLLDALLAGACASVSLFSLSPVSRTWNDAAVREALMRPPSPFSGKPRSPSAEAKAAMTEVLAGRAALLGCLILLLVERQTGFGALEQLGLLARVEDGGVPLASSPSLAGARVLLLWVAFAAVAWAARFPSSKDDERR